LTLFDARGTNALSLNAVTRCEKVKGPDVYIPPRLLTGTKLKY